MKIFHFTFVHGAHFKNAVISAQHIVLLGLHFIVFFHIFGVKEHIILFRFYVKMLVPAVFMIFHEMHYLISAVFK